jgi:3'-phosphoadenosine 5'-phosphosulfate sulfotransferase (PAPS reductase)/FAD synthetase
LSELTDISGAAERVDSSRIRAGKPNIGGNPMQTAGEHAVNAAKTQSTIHSLTDALHGHSRVGLAFSGGKDSLACLELLRMAGARPAMFWVNTGASVPRMEAFVRRVTEGLELIEVRTDQRAYWRENGIPSRVIPMFNHRAGLQDEPEPPRPLIVDWTSCHIALVEAPLWEAVAGSGVTLLVHGQRGDDGLVAPRHPFKHFRTVLPLAAWSTEDVFAFLHARGVEMPAQYPEVVASMDCWNCPALTTPDKIRYLKREYPEKADELKKLMTVVYVAIRTELERSMLPSLMAMYE